MQVQSDWHHNLNQPEQTGSSSACATTEFVPEQNILQGMYGEIVLERGHFERLELGKEKVEGFTLASSIGGLLDDRGVWCLHLSSRSAPSSPSVSEEWNILTVGAVCAAEGAKRKERKNQLPRFRRDAA